MSDPYGTEKIYPVLESAPTPPPTPTARAPSPHEYRIGTCRKILEIIEADAKHYSSTLKKYTRSRNIFSYLAGLGFGIASRKMSRKVSKHVDNVARARATIIAIEIAISKALRDGVISDEEFRIVSNIDNKYHNRLATLRRSANSQDFKKMREQIEEEMKAGLHEFLLKKKEPTAPPAEN